MLTNKMHLTFIHSLEIRLMAVVMLVIRRIFFLQLINKPQIKAELHVMDNSEQVINYEMKR